MSNYSIEIYTAGWQQKIYSSYNQAVHSNGFIFVWDGSGANSNGVYKVIIEYTDCNGNSHTEYEDIDIFGLKSAEEELPNTTDTEITNVAKVCLAMCIVILLLMLHISPNSFK